MKLLLDTHVLLWHLLEPDRLEPRTRALLAAADTEIHLSVVTAWELLVKHDLGKLPLPDPPLVLFDRACSAIGAGPLALERPHLDALVGLPRHHRDPFDRMLIAQAIAMDWTLVSADEALRAYPVRILWAPA